MKILFNGEFEEFKYDSKTGEVMMFNKLFDEWEYFNGSERQKRSISSKLNERLNNILSDEDL